MGLRHIVKWLEVTWINVRLDIILKIIKFFFLNYAFYPGVLLYVGPMIMINKNWVLPWITNWVFGLVVFDDFGTFFPATQWKESQ